MSKLSQYRPLDFTPGVRPSTDGTITSTQHWTASQGIVFTNGKPEKRGGWQKISIYRNTALSGVARSVFSMQFNNANQTLIGTTNGVYSLTGSQLTNITPFQATSVAAANSLSTQYGTLATNPVTTTVGSNLVKITDPTAAFYMIGDYYTLSGATATGGVPATDINQRSIVRAVGTNAITIKTTTVATSTATGGGAGVTRSSGLITLAKTAHGLSNGNRINVQAATAAGGVTAPQINANQIIRNVTANTFDFMTDGTATSAVTAGGGAATVYYAPIASGNANEVSQEGYGAGRYGVGLYGTALQSSAGRVYPRIWYFDRFGANAIMTAGNQTGIYQWNGMTTTAPTLVPNAPTAVNYAFISDNILVTFGAGGFENHIFSSDQGNISQWVASSANAVFEIYVNGAGRLISHVPVIGKNLIFTQTQTYTFRFVGIQNNVWEIIQIDPAIGIISSMARCSVRGVAYWMGQDNFYMYRGNAVEVIPANSQIESTIKNYVFSNINKGQASKIFSCYNPIKDQVEFYYPSAGSNECDSMAVVSLGDFVWWPDLIDRTAGEYPTIGNHYPKMVSYAGGIFNHEIGMDDDKNPLPFSVSSPNVFNGKYIGLIENVIPDSQQTGNITLTMTGRTFPQSQNPTSQKSFSVTPTQEKIATAIGGRVGQYVFSGNALNQAWRMGEWFDDYGDQI